MCGLDEHADEALLSGLADGGQAATLSFVRRFQGRVYGITLGISGDAIQAEEIATSTFKYAADNAHTYDARQYSVGTWLVWLAVKGAIDSLATGRQTSRQAAGVVGRDGSSMVGSERGGVPVPQARMRAALQQLPVDQARAIVLAAIGRLPTEEIAIAENVPIHTAKSRVRLGMKHLRGALSTDQAVGDSHQLSRYQGS